MGEPIRIVITVEDQQALAKLQEFIKSSDSGLKQLSAGSSQGFKEMAEGAKEAGAHIAGMSFYARSGIDSIRLALAGGGARAGFYAIDEAVRGLLASGIRLSTLVPIMSGVAAVLAPFALIWATFKQNEQEAIDKHNEFVQTLKEFPGVIQGVNDAAKSGLISKDLQQNLLAQLGVGSRPVPSDFKITQPPFDPSRIFPVANAQPGRLPSIPGFPQAEDLKEVNAQLEKAGFLISKIDKDGNKTFEPSDKGQALLKLIELHKQFSLETVSGYDKERAKAKQTYDEQTAELEDLIERSGRGLEAAGLNPEKLRADLKASFDATNREIDFKQRNEEQQKADEAFTKGQAEFAKTVSKENSDLERQLTLDAANAGKTREENFQHEYDARVRLLTQQLYAGEIDEQQYTDAFQEATAKRVEGMNREALKRQRLHDETVRMQQEDAKETAEQTLRNPFALQPAKEQALQSLIEQTQALLNQNRTELELVETEKERNDLIRERQQLERQLSDYKVQQLEQEKAMNNARMQGVHQMFGNMAAAAKAFGAEGLAAYKGFAIAEAVIDTAKAAIGAYSSVVGIPYVGPVLAPIAAAAAVAAGAVQISAIEAASAREFGGPVEAGQPYIVGERRAELFVPESDGYIMPSVPRSIGAPFSGGTSSASPQSQRSMHFNFFSDKNEITKHLRENPDAQHAIVDIARRNVHFVQSRA